MKWSLRQLLEFHTRFETGAGFFEEYARSVQDKIMQTGVSPGGGIVLSETHKKLIAQAKRQNILHRDMGYVRAIRLAEEVYYYDVGLLSIDGGLFSRGTSLRLDEAVARAFGELYERVSMRFVPEGETVTYASARQLEERKLAALRLPDLPQATREQKKAFPRMNWDDDSVFGWVWARNVFTHDPVLVPAQLAHWGYRRREDEPLLGQISTHGLGAGYDPEGALESAAAELVQRHSFFSFWYAMKAPPKIALESVLRAPDVAEYLRSLIRSVQEYGLEIHLLDCTLPESTASVAVVLTRKGAGWFVGMSTARSYEKAIERGLCEALSTYAWAMDNVHQSPQSVFEEKDFSSGFCDPLITDVLRVQVWSQEKAAAHGRFFLGGAERRFEEPPRGTVSPVEALRRFSKGQAFVRYAKRPYLDEAGFHSAFAVAPHLFRLALYEDVSTPVLDGVEPKNRYPHPFP